MQTMLKPIVSGGSHWSNQPHKPNSSPLFHCERIPFKQATKDHGYLVDVGAPRRCWRPNNRCSTRLARWRQDRQDLRAWAVYEAWISNQSTGKNPHVKPCLLGMQDCETRGMKRCMMVGLGVWVELCELGWRSWVVWDELCERVTEGVTEAETDGGSGMQS